MLASRPGARLSSRGILLGLLLIGSSAFAQQDQELSRDVSARLLDHGHLRLRYGVSLRSGGQDDFGPGLSYSGMTPNDVALSAGWYPFAHGGALVSVQREAFALLQGQTRVTSGALLRASVGPSGRVVLGPLRLEAFAGYGLAQLPEFRSSAQPDFQPATRHAVLLASRAALALPFGVIAEARGEYPLAVEVSDGGGGKAQAEGFSAGGGISLPVYRGAGVEGRLALDYQYVSDRLTTAGGAVSSQSLSRVGAALELAWVPPGDHPRAPRTEILPGQVASLELRLQKEPPRTGSLRVVVTAKEGAKPLAGAKVKVKDAEQVTDALGVASFEALPPGAAGVRVEAEGYEPGDEAAQIVAGGAAEIPVALLQAKQVLPATVSGIVRSTRGQPLRARLEIPELSLTTTADEQGAFTFTVPAGRYRMIISAPLYRRQVKPVSVKPGDQAIFNVDLHLR